MVDDGELYRRVADVTKRLRKAAADRADGSLSV
jgi:hypothetical protein